METTSANAFGGSCPECCWDLDDRGERAPGGGCRFCDEPAAEREGPRSQVAPTRAAPESPDERDSTSDAASERELVLRAQALDGDAVASLFHAYYPRMYRYGLVQLRNVHVAEDFASDVMLRMLDGLGKYEVRDRPFSAWVYRIARNRLIDMQRRRMRCRESPLDERLELAGATGSGAIAQLLDIEEIQRGLCRLSDGQAQVVVLRFLQDLDVPTVARILGRSERAIKSLQFRALSSLRQALRTATAGVAPPREARVPVTPLQ